MEIPFWASNTAAGFEGPLYSTNPHEVVVLNGEPLPGLCKVTALPTQQVDRQKVKGRDGETVIMRGYLPGPIDIECLVWTPEQWARLQEIIRVLWIRPGKTPASTDQLKAGSSEAAFAALIADVSAVSISHPSLQLFGISRVVITGISIPEEGPVPQSRIVNIKCLEFVETPAAKNVTRKTKGSTPPRVKRAEELMSKKIEWIDSQEPPSKGKAGGPMTPTRAPAQTEWVTE